MLRQVKSAIGSPKSVNEMRVIPPTLKLLLKHMEFSALRINLQQATFQQMIQSEGFNWGPQHWFRAVHLHRRTS